MTAFLIPATLLILSSCSHSRVHSDFDPRTSFNGLRTYMWVHEDKDVPAIPALQGQLVAERVQNAVDSYLAARGYRRVTSGRADFRVGYYIVANDRAEAGPGTAPETASSPQIALAGYGFRSGGHHGGRLGQRTFRGRRYRGTGFSHFGYHAYPNFGYHFRGYHTYPYSGYYGHYGYPRYHYGFETAAGHGVATPTLVIEMYEGQGDRMIWRGWARQELGNDPDRAAIDKYVRKAVRKILKAFPPDRRL